MLDPSQNRNLLESAVRRVTDKLHNLPDKLPCGFQQFAPARLGLVLNRGGAGDWMLGATIIGLTRYGK